LSSYGKSPCSTNPHGAPLNPSDIYTLSDDVRKRAFRPDLPADYPLHDSPQTTGQTPGWQNLHSPNNINNNNEFTFESNGFTSNYDTLLRDAPATNRGTGEATPAPPNHTPNIIQGQGQPAAADYNLPATQGSQDVDFGFPDANQWFVFFHFTVRNTLK
jgi:hypothetical protein